MSVLTLYVDEVMRTLSNDGQYPFVENDKTVDIVRFALNSGFADIVLDGQVALRVMYQRPGESQVRAQTLTYYDTDGLHNYYDWQLSQSDLAKNGSLMVALCILDISGGEVSEWHTTPCAVRVLSTIHTDDSDEGDDTITPTVKERVAVLETMIQRVASGAPIVVTSTSAMTDTEQIYVLSTDGNWYYHNGSTWIEGGEYGAVSTDTTLSQSGIPADAKVVGDAIAAIEPGLSYDAKIALLDCFAHVAWTDAHGQNYYDALSDALNLSRIISSISAVFTQGSAVIYTDNSLNDLKPYLTVTARYSDGTAQTVTNYTLSGTLTKGTSTITASYGGKTDTFNVTVSERSATLQSITAVFNQGSAVIYTDSSLNDLKPYLTVTARYSDSTTQTVIGYTLSGTLTKGTSAITASYGGKTATFNVVVSERSSGTAVYKLSDGTLAPLTKGSITTVDDRPCINQNGLRQVINVLHGEVPYLTRETSSSSATESIYYPIPIPSSATKVTVSVLPNTLQVNANIRKYENGTFTIVQTGDKSASVQYDLTASENLYVVGVVQTSDGSELSSADVTDVIIECE